MMGIFKRMREIEERLDALEDGKRRDEASAPTEDELRALKDFREGINNILTYNGPPKKEGR